MRDETAAAPKRAELLVCVKCRAPGAAPEDTPRGGAQLFEALSGADLPDGVALKAVDCMQNCEQGCTVALRGSGRWSYIYGHVQAAQDVETLLTGAALYRETADGLIPWRARPDLFKKNCIARIPPLEAPND